MKRRNLLYIGALACLSACSYDKLPTYDDVDRIYFAYSNDPNTKSQKTINLGYDTPIKDDSLVSIPVIIMGNATNANRPINFEVVGSESSAVPGEDIILLPSYIPAGTTEGNIFLTVKHTPKTDTQTLMARIRLLPGSYFHVDYTGGVGTNAQGNSLEYTLFFDAKNDKPSLWADPEGAMALEDVFGPYSNKKFEVICTACNKTRDFFTIQPGETVGEIIGENGRFQQAVRWGMLSIVNRYLKEKGPILDENGNVITTAQPTII